MDDFNQSRSFYNPSGTGYDPNYTSMYCLERLPCGYCMILKTPCPMMPTQITWEVMNGEVK